MRDDPIAREILEQLKAGRSFTENQKQQIESRAAELDEAYLNLQDKVDEGEAKRADSLKAFFKARAMAALSYAVSDSPDAAREAIYEASSAIDGDKSQFLSIVETRLD
jgi:multidrug efflux pump subunit AcrA (membrane-fusion protein)